MPSLIVVGKKRTEEFPLTDAVTVIGRDKGVNLELSDFKASRRHARVILEGGVVEVEDLQSSNGTLLNGEDITRRSGQAPPPARPLGNGDRILLANVELVLRRSSLHGNLPRYGITLWSDSGTGSSMSSVSGARL